jgi:hypothetical protein
LGQQQEQQFQQRGTNNRFNQDTENQQQMGFPQKTNRWNSESENEYQERLRGQTAKSREPGFRWNY